MPDTLTPANKKPSLNTAGWLVLILGCAIALFVYWSGGNHSDGAYSDSPLATQDSKSSSRDVAMVSGQLGVWMAEWSDWVAGWKPSTMPALIIAAVSVVAALGCFAVANRWV